MLIYTKHIHLTTIIVQSVRLSMYSFFSFRYLLVGFICHVHVKIYVVQPDSLCLNESCNMIDLSNGKDLNLIHNLMYVIGIFFLHLTVIIED